MGRRLLTQGLCAAGLELEVISRDVDAASAQVLREDAADLAVADDRGAHRQSM